MDKLKVFISDDSATIRERLVTIALDLPEVDVVGQAQDAPGTLDALRQIRADVVILDIRMPGGNGIEVLREAGSAARSITCECGERISYWVITAQLRKQKTMGRRIQKWFRSFSTAQD